MLIYMCNNWLLKLVFISCILRACVNQLQVSTECDPLSFKHYDQKGVGVGGKLLSL